MRGMCGKEEENRERFNSLERQQRRKENSENQTTKMLFEPPLSSIILHTPGFHQSSYSNYRFFLQYLNPIPFLVQYLIRVGMRRLP